MTGFVDRVGVGTLLGGFLSGTTTTDDSRETVPFEVSRCIGAPGLYSGGVGDTRVTISNGPFRVRR